MNLVVGHVSYCDDRFVVDHVSYLIHEHDPLRRFMIYHLP